MLASSINAEFASASICAVRGGTAGISALGSSSDKFGLALLFICTSMLTGAFKTNTASACVGAFTRGGAGVTTLGSFHNLSERGRCDKTLIHASVLADPINAKSAVTSISAIT